MKNLLFTDAEDPNYPLMAPYLYALALAGIRLKPEKSFFKLFSISIPIYVLISITVYVDLIKNINDFSAVCQNLGINVTITMGVIKVLFTLYHKKTLSSLINDLSQIEIIQINENDEEMIKLKEKYRNYTRFVMKIYFYSVVCTCTTWNATPILLWLIKGEFDEPFPEIFVTLYPFNKKEYPGNIFGYMIDVYYFYYGAFMHVAWDSCVIAMMCFFAGQLEILRYRLSIVFEVDDERIINDNIVECCRMHNILIEYSKKLSNFLSTVVFFFLLISSFCLGALILEFVMETSIYTQTRKISSLFGVTLEFFLLYWHSSKTLSMSQKLGEGLYNSKWYERDPRLRSTIVTLMLQFKRPIVFSAGPFYDMTTETFLTICKAAYSYFTLLSQSSKRRI